MNYSLTRRTNGAFHILASLILIAVLGWWGVGLAILSLYGGPRILGTSYPVVNTTTVTDLTNVTSKAREELWVRRVVLGADRSYQDNPFADNFMGRVNVNKPDPRQLKKAVIMLTETEKVAGNTINIPTVAGFGGPGVSGEGNRIGSEQKIVPGNFPVKIGRFWFGIGFTAVARDETVIGGKLDQVISDGLRTLHAKKRSDDVMMRMRQGATTALGAIRNVQYPAGCNSIADLGSANVLDTTLVNVTGQRLPGNGAIPMDTTNDSGGSVGECFVCFATDMSLTNLQQEPAYLQALEYAHERGNNNPVFAGGFTKWNGHGIYRWINRDHANRGPIGSPLMARAFLGGLSHSGTPTYTGNVTVQNGDLIYGGGVALNTADIGVSTDPNYFEFFENSPYTFFNGDTIAADSSTTRYVMFLNTDGTFGVFPYILNDGHKLTISGGAVAVGPAGKRTTSFGVGTAQIIQCNASGVPYARSLFLGAEAVAVGAGTINGSRVDPQMGKRTEEHRNHDMDHGIGVEAVWGSALVTRAGDSIAPNYMLMYHALSVPGAPTM